MTRDEARHQILTYWQSWKAGLAPGDKPDMKGFLRFIAGERSYLLPEVNLAELRLVRDWLIDFERRARR